MAIPVVETFTFKDHPAGSPRTSITLTKPTGVVSGDLLVLFCLSDDNGADDAFQDTKSGWTVMLQTGDGSSSAKLAIYYRISDGTEASTETVTMDAEDDVIGWYLRISGVDQTTPINVQNEGASTTNSSNRAISGVTTTVDDCLAFYVLVFDGADGFPFSVSGTGWTETQEGETPLGDGTDVSGCWGNKDMATQGATGTATVSMSASDGHAFCQFAIAPAPVGPTIADVDTDNEIDDKQTAVTVAGTTYEAAQGTGKVEISDNATYGSGNVVAQTVTSWSDTAIDITVVLGAMAPGTPRYVWVTNDSAERNATGFQVHVHRAHAFQVSASAHIAASGENTTARLAAPAGKTTGDFGGGRISDDENPGDAVDLAADKYREDVLCMKAADDAEDAQYEFRLLYGGAVADTISQIPKWTVTSVGPQTATPSPVVAKFVIPAPTLVAGVATLTPAPVAAKFIVPAPTVTNALVVTPSPVVATFAVPAPTLVAGVATLTPSPVVATFSVGTPTLVAGAVTLTPAPVVAKFVVPAPTLVAGAVTLTPSAVVAKFVVPAPTLVAGVATLTPAAVLAKLVVPAPTVTGINILTPDAVVAKLVIPAPTVVMGVVVLTPSPVVATLVVPAPTLVVGVATLTPAAVVTKFVVPTPTVTNAQIAAPSPVVAKLVVPAPTLVAGAVTLTPSAVVAKFSVPAPTVVAGVVVLTPSPVVATFSVPAPTVIVGVATLTPSPIVVKFLVGTPTLVAGVATLTPTAVVAKFVIPAPTVIAGGLLAPSPVVAKFLIAAPTVVGGAVTISPEAVVMRFLLPAPVVSVPSADDLALQYAVSGGSSQIPTLNSMMRGRR